MKKTLFVLALVAVAMTMGTTTASAQATGTTDLTVSIPDLVILYYYDTVSVSIDAEALAALAGDTVFANPELDEILAVTGGTTSASALESSGDLTADLAISPTSTGLSNATLTLQNAWAVRGLSSFSYEAGIALGATPNLTNGGSVIGVSNPAINVGGGSYGTSNVNVPVSGLGTPTNGNVQLTLDLSTVTLSGDHSSTGTYTITVSQQ
jgi:hypothetical protein